MVCEKCVVLRGEAVAAFVSHHIGYRVMESIHNANFTTQSDTALNDTD
jgi:hypothetical protein